MKITKDIHYDQNNGLLLDLYEPEEFQQIVITFHGGGWFRGDKAKEKEVATRFTEAGYLAIAPNYRLAPANLFPSALEDALTVFDWVKERYPNIPIVVFGASAGGNLAIEVALQRGVPAVSWSGIIDLKDWVEKHPDVIPAMNQDQTQQESKLIDQDGANEAFYKWFILNYIPKEQLAEATPLTRVSDKSGPILTVNSLNELVPVSGVLMLHKALAAVDIATTSIMIPGNRHGEGYLEDVWEETLAFLKAV